MRIVKDLRARAFSAAYVPAIFSRLRRGSVSMGDTLTAELLTTLLSATVYNGSGTASQADQPFTFGATFAPGEISSSGHPQPKYSGSALTYQVDREVYGHPDGSLSRAVFTVLAPQIPGSSNAAIDVYAASGAKPAGSVGLSAIQAAAYSVEVDVGGSTYTAVLNDAITAGDYETTRDGPVATRIRAWRTLGAHPDLHCSIYATAFSDGSTQVLGQIVNGYVSNGANYTISEARLKADGVTVWSYNNGGSGWTMNHHSSFFTADSDGLPYWDSGTPALYSVPDGDRLSTTRAWWPYRTVTGISAPSTTLDYAPGTTGDYRTDINGTGDTEHIGFLPNWTTKAILSGAESWMRRDRVNALIWTDAPFVYYNAGLKIPVLTTTDHTADGLDASQYDVAWGGSSTITNPTPRDWVGELDGSHNPEPAYIQALVTGDEWFDDIQLLMANNALGVENPATSTSLASVYQRSPPKTTGGNWTGIVRRGQHRGWGWNLRAVGCAHWLCPESAIERGYITEIRDQNYAYLHDQMTGRYPGTTYDALGVLDFVGHPYGRNTIWESSFMACSILLAYYRDQKQGAVSFANYHVSKWLLGQAYDGCPYNLGAYYLSMDPNDDGVYAQTWADVRLSDQTTPFIPAGGCPTSGMGNSWSSGAYAYAVIGMAAAYMAQVVATEYGDSDLLTRAQYVSDYVAPEVAANVSDAQWQADPKYGVNASGQSSTPSTSYLDGMSTYEVRALTSTYSPGSNETIADVTSSEWVTSDPGTVGLQMVVGSWSGGVGMADKNQLLVTGGGHNDSANNGKYMYDFSNNGGVPTGWSVDSLSAVASVSQNDPYSDGLPGARHTYQGVAYCQSLNRVYLYGGVPWNSAGGFVETLWEYDFATSTWTQLPTPNGVQNGQSPILVIDESAQKAFACHQGSYNGQFIDLATRTLGSSTSWDYSPTWHDATCGYDPTRKRLYRWPDQTYWTLDFVNETVVETTFTATGDTAILSDIATTAVYDPTGDCMWIFGGNSITGPGYSSIYRFDPATNAVTANAMSGDSFTFDSTDANYHGSYGRAVMLDSWRAIGFVTNTGGPAYVIKVPA